MKTKSKPQVIILNGWGQEKSHWALVRESLNQFYPTESLDMPGFGDLSASRKVISIAEYANWTKRKIENKFTNQEIILIGHSFGGRIAAEIASSNPDWLKHLILISAPCVNYKTIFTKANNFVAALAKKLIPDGKFKRLIRDHFTSTDLQKVRGKHMEKVFRAAINYDQSRKLTKINSPSTLIWGENDAEVPIKVAKVILKLIPECKLAILPELGHNIHLENPSLLFGTIKNTIQNINK